MIWELIAMLASGAAVAGVVMLLRHIAPRLIARWVTFAAAAGAMIAFSVNAEYSWYPRNVAALPEGFKVVITREESAWYRPWTLARPYTAGFIAVDTGSVQTNPALPDARLASIYIFSRNAMLAARPAVFDCAGSRRADIVDLGTLPTEGDWIPVAADDPTLTTVCEA